MINDIFEVLKIRARLLGEKEKDCMICLDEMSIKSNLFYDISKDKIIGFEETLNRRSTDLATSALVVMVRGVASNWKQPLAYFFYKSSAVSTEIKDILYEVVIRLNGTGLNVLGVVSDQGPNFQKLVKNCLHLTEEVCSFFINGKKLIYLFDVPHLLKSTRNNFFKYKFLLENGETNKRYVKMLYNRDKIKEYRLCPRLTDNHIFPNNFEKMKVRYASQVLSHSVAVALNTYIDFGVLSIEAKPTAIFIQKMNDLFDLLNSCHLNNYNAFMGTEKQNDFLKTMLHLFENVKVVDNNGKEVTKQMRFLFGWKMAIRGVLELWQDLKNRGYSFLLTP